MSRKAFMLFIALSLWQGLAVTACADARNLLTIGCDGWCRSAQWRGSDYATIEAQLAAAKNPRRQVMTSGEGGVTPLHWVAAFGEARSPLEEKNRDGWTPLHYAAGFNKEAALVDILLQAGAALDAVDDRGRTPLHLAAEHHNEVIYEKLLAAGADSSIKDNRDRLAADVLARTKKLSDAPFWQKLLAIWQEMGEN